MQVYSICFSFTIALKKELDSVKSKHNELSEKLLDRSRQYQKLQSMYDSLRRYIQYSQLGSLLLVILTGEQSLLHPLKTLLVVIVSQLDNLSYSWELHVIKNVN